MIHRKEFFITNPLDNYIIASILFYCNDETLEINVMSLYVEPEYRNLKFGTELLQKIIRYGKINKYKKIILDDMTNTKPEHNIYCNNGFQYVKPNFGPEMFYDLTS